MSAWLMVDTAQRKRTCHLCNGTIVKGDKLLFVGGKIRWNQSIHKNVCKACMSDILTDTPIVDRAQRVRFITNPNHRRMVLQEIDEEPGREIIQPTTGRVRRVRRPRRPREVPVFTLADLVRTRDNF